MADGRRPMAERFKNAETLASLGEAVGDGLDDLRSEMLERLTDVIRDVGSLRSLFKWVIATFTTATLAAMGVLISVLT